MRFYGGVCDLRSFTEYASLYATNGRISRRGGYSSTQDFSPISSGRGAKRLPGESVRTVHSIEEAPCRIRIKETSLPGPLKLGARSFLRRFSYYLGRSFFV